MQVTDAHIFIVIKKKPFDAEVAKPVLAEPHRELEPCEGKRSQMQASNPAVRQFTLGGTRGMGGKALRKL